MTSMTCVTILSSVTVVYLGLCTCTDPRIAHAFVLAYVQYSPCVVACVARLLSEPISATIFFVTLPDVATEMSSGRKSWYTPAFLRTELSGG